MPSEILIPTAQNLPDGFCPTTWQSTVNAFAAAMRVTLPVSASQIIVQQNTPAPADQNKIWFQVDGNNHVLAIKSFDSGTGEWERVDEEQYYFNDIGTTNSIQIISSVAGDNVTALSDLVGRLLIIKVANANSATSVTITVDGLTPTAVKKYGSTTLDIGNITAGMVCMFVYDGTNFQLLNPKLVFPTNSYLTTYNKSAVFACPAPGIAQEWIHGFTSVPDIYDCYLICRVATIGYNPGDRVHYSIVQSFREFSETTFALVATDSILRIIGGGGSTDYFQFANKSTGIRNITAHTNWDIQFIATKFVAT